MSTNDSVDAARYRWLLESGEIIASSTWGRIAIPMYTPTEDHKIELDRHIDAARLAGSAQHAPGDPVASEGLGDEQRSKLEFIAELTHDYHQRVSAQVRILLAAQPACEPVAWGLLHIQDPELTNDGQLAAYWERKGRKVTPLYATPVAPTERAIKDES